MMENNSEKRTHSSKVYDWDKYFMKAHAMHLKKAFRNDSNFWCVNIVFEDTTTWKYIHIGLTPDQSKGIIFKDTTFLMFNSRSAEIDTVCASFLCA